MKTLIKLVLLIIVLSPGNVKSQQLSQPDSLLNNMIGEWTLNGIIDGKKTTHDIVVNRVLNGQYVQIKEMSREKDLTGKPLYEAIVYICWEESKKQYSCLWLDNTSNGGISNGIIGRAKQNTDKIEFLFIYNEKSQFHTTFQYNEKTKIWQWFMDGEENDKIQSFARVTLTKHD
jgi:hypothetical protein